jgi:hypothetical protein
MPLMAKRHIHWDRDSKLKIMQIQLINTEFSSSDALDIIGQMIQIKIKYHENKIAKNSNEEDIKYREAKIKRLQKELYDLRSNLTGKEGNVKLDATIKIEA